jgi:putative glutamine amidotransferase
MVGESAILSPFFALQETGMTSKPIIGCTVYRHQAALEMMALTEAYIEAVYRSGGLPVMIPLGLDTNDLQTLLSRVDGILLPGGGDIDPSYYRHPPSDLNQRIDMDRDRVEIGAAQTAVIQQKPLLAICRGHQVLNVALGGTLWADIPSQMPHAIAHDFDDVKPRHYAAHSVTILPDSALAYHLGTTETAVNSLHHQGIRDLAPSLRAVAMAPDGLIEGVEVPDHPFAIGVQWHPEWLLADNPAMHRLFQGFVAAARNGRDH